ncbi:hypothetical protein B0H10DRAFT_2305328 [Mycena sp. CBHHK59/15]|nr:hypothetical protein B0H10DRAFT_2305328 [Mycena sp. CBHHK59/15]
MTPPPARFPLDLEREIFETLAIMYPTTISHLLTVARRVRAWIEPLMYTALSFKTGSPRLSGFLLAIQSKSAEFFRDNVRHLHIQYGCVKVDELLQILNVCTRLSTISLFDADPQIIPYLDAMRLRSITISLQRLLGAGPILKNVAHPLFDNTTHLYIYDFIHSEDSASGLAALPSLTHLCVNLMVSRSFLCSVFADCARIQVLINLYFDKAHGWDLENICDDLAIDDPRFVLIVVRIAEYRADWASGTRGGKDFWACASEFVAKKQRGEIQPDYPSLVLTWFADWVPFGLSDGCRGKGCSRSSDHSGWNVIRETRFQRVTHVRNAPSPWLSLWPSNICDDR